jgi:hypothetical protein
MNAYELADELEQGAELEMKLQRPENWADLTKAANMLRQQADRIAELEKSHIELEKGIVADLNQRQSAEPVAWMSNGKEFYVQKNYCPDFIPLYTTPQIKELSDEEILNLYKETEADNGGIREFARAILKKASEK